MLKFLNRTAAALLLCTGATHTFAAEAPPVRVAAPAKLGTVAVVCPAAWQPTLEPWVKHRTAQGWHVELLAPKPNAKQQLADIHQRHAQAPLTALLLVGDSVAEPTNPLQPLVATQHVASQVITRWNGEPQIASDLPYADPKNIGQPEFAIGRWPVDDKEQLKLVIAKTLAYEASRDFGPWRGRINLVAGIGGFGALTDAAIEQGARTIVLSGLPAAYEPTLTFGSWTSPHCPDPRKFAESARARMSEGCLFWVYIGHGHPRGLDLVRMPNRKAYEIMECRDCVALTPPKTAPLAMFLACSTGAFDKPEDCLAEDLLRSDSGPVAILASSRVAMPYGLSVFATEALQAGLVERTATLGEIVRLAKVRALQQKDPAGNTPRGGAAIRNMLDSIAGLLTPGGHDSRLELLEHAHLLQLFGDPCLKMVYPESITLAGPAKAKAGSKVEFTATLAAGSALETKPGPLRWELRMPPGRLKESMPAREKYLASDAQWTEMQTTYEAALDAVISSQTAAAENAWQASFTFPANAKGEYQVRLWYAHEGGFVAGTHKIVVE
jgi:hypothetical protein